MARKDRENLEQLMASNQIYREVYQSQQEGVSIDG